MSIRDNFKIYIVFFSFCLFFSCALNNKVQKKILPSNDNNDITLESEKNLYDEFSLEINKKLNKISEYKYRVDSLILILNKRDIANQNQLSALNQKINQLTN